MQCSSNTLDTSMPNSNPNLCLKIYIFVMKYAHGFAFSRYDTECGQVFFLVFFKTVSQVLRLPQCHVQQPWWISLGIWPQQGTISVHVLWDALYNVNDAMYIHLCVVLEESCLCFYLTCCDNLIFNSAGMLQMLRRQLTTGYLKPLS